MINTAKYRSLLNARLSELEHRLHDIEDELDSHQSKDWEELAVEREEDEVLNSMGASGQTEIARINAALARMDKGEFGICVACGDDISDERLELIPFTPFCASCAGKAG